MVLLVENSPFTEQQVKLLNELLPNLTDTQKIWLNGYLSAPGATIAQATEALQTQEVVPQTITATILYASQTGNSQKLAESFGAELAQNQVDVTVASMTDFKPKDLKKLEHLIIVASTHGEGEAPDNAIAFYDFLHSKRAPKLEQLKYAVLALGDSSYEFFCKTGADFDERLKALGATQIVPRVDCDVDYDDDAAAWFTSLQQALLKSTGTAQPAQTTAAVTTSATTYDKKHPFQAEILEKINLNMDGSNKETYHIELSLEDSGITFEPGDSLGIIPNNDPAVVAQLIEALGFAADTTVTVNDDSVTLEQALTERLEITVVSKPLVQKLAAFTEADVAALLAGDFPAYSYGRDLVDFVTAYGPFNWTAQQFVEQLRAIPHRLYSIASSYNANPDEVHLTIGKVAYEAHGRARTGVASGQVADRLEIGDTVSVFVKENPNFKLPENDDTPIIMIGAGTGVAPFRSFVEERAEQGTEGKSWLFFGEQHFMLDFLYQVEWLNYLKDGALTRMDVAFSRDQAEKVYVQHRLQEKGAEVYEWLQQGAVIYVCGDEKAMAKDVHETLIQIIEQHGKVSREEAVETLQQYQQQKRYQRDVY
jgi:sulfite reductase (NADPH) flavoprotein alpha-component